MSTIPQEVLDLIPDSPYNSSTTPDSLGISYTEPTQDVLDLVGDSGASMLSNQGYSLAELEQDEEFSKIAARFLSSVNKHSITGGDDDIFEYLRDSEYSLSSALDRSFQISNKWTEQDKTDYNYLKEKFSNADIKTLRHRLKAITNATSDIVFDPFTLASVLFVPFTGGQSLVGRLVAGKAAQKAIKDFSTHQLATGAAKVAAVEGMAWEGAHNYFNQKIDTKLGMGPADIDILSVATGALQGGIAGGAAGYGITRALPIIGKGLSSTKQFLDKTFRFSNEQDIIKAGNQSRKEINKESLLDDVRYGRTPLGQLSETFFEKPTTKFIKYAKGSKTLKEFLSRIRYDYDDAIVPLEVSAKPTKGVKTRKAKQVKRESYGLAQARKQYSYITNMRKALQTLDRQGFMAHLTTEDNNLLVHLLRNPKATSYKGKPIKSYIVKASKEVKKLLDDVYKEGNKVGVFTDKQKVTNYFPRRFNHSQVAGNRAELENLLIKYGHADPKFDYAAKDYVTGITATGKEDKVLKHTANPIDVDSFGDKIAKEIKDLFEAGDIEGAKRLKAETIVDNMLEYKYTPFDFLQKGRATGGYGFMQQRVFQDIPDEELAPFLENNVEKVLTDYFTSATQAIERTRFFGKNYEDFGERFLTKIRKELRESGMPRTEIRELEKDLNLLYGRVTGLDTPREKGLYRSFSEWGRLAQQMAHLPLATLSSVTEPLILLSRVPLTDAPQVVLDVASALSKGTGKMLDRSLQTILRTAGKPLGYKQKGSQAFKDLDDETWSEVYKTGLALEQAVMDRIEGMYGEAFESAGARVLQNAFFSSNLLTQWTGAVQLASFTTGKRLITENIEKLYKHSTGEVKLSKGKVKMLRDQLWELGVDDKRGMQWYKRSLKNGKLDFNQSTTGKNKYFYDNYIQAGANRFTKEVILNPNVAEANKPLWFNSPAGKLLTQFAGYPTVFTNTVLKRFAKKLTTRQSPQTMAAMITMTAGAIIGNAIRSEGKSLERDDHQIILDAVQRWGGLGPLEYGKRYQENVELGGGFVGGLSKALPGPLVQDYVDSLLYRKGFFEIMGTNLPGYSAYDFVVGEGTQAEIKAEGRDIDNDLRLSSPLYAFIFGSKASPIKEGDFVQTGEADRTTNAKGGLVYNVSNVHPEPDEVKMRGVNATYNEVAGDILKDEEDRRGFASAGLVKLTKPFRDIAGEALKTLFRYVRQDTIKEPPPIIQKMDNEPLTYLTDDEIQDYVSKDYTDMPDVVYRPMRSATDFDNLSPFFINDEIGVPVFLQETRAIATTEAKLNYRNRRDNAYPTQVTDIDLRTLQETVVPGVIRAKNFFPIKYGSSSPFVGNGYVHSLFPTIRSVGNRRTANLGPFKNFTINYVDSSLWDDLVKNYKNYLKINKKFKKEKLGSFYDPDSEEVLVPFSEGQLNLFSRYELRRAHVLEFYQNLEQYALSLDEVLDLVAKSSSFKGTLARKENKNLYPYYDEEGRLTLGDYSKLPETLQPILGSEPEEALKAVDMFSDYQIGELIPAANIKNFFREMAAFSSLWEQQFVGYVREVVDKAKNFVGPEVSPDENLFGPRGRSKPIYSDLVNVLNDKEIFNSTDKLMYKLGTFTDSELELYFPEFEKFIDVYKLYENKKVEELIKKLGFQGVKIETNLGTSSTEPTHSIFHLFDSSQFKAIDNKYLKKRYSEGPDSELISQPPILNIGGYIPLITDSLKFINNKDYSEPMTFDLAKQRVQNIEGLKELEKDYIIKYLDQRSIDRDSITKQDILDASAFYFDDLADLAAVRQPTKTWYAAHNSLISDRKYDKSNKRLTQSLVRINDGDEVLKDVEMHIVRYADMFKMLKKRNPNEDEALSEIYAQMENHTDGYNDVLSFAARSRRKDSEGTDSFVIDQIQTDLKQYLKDTPFTNSVFKFPVLSILREAAQKGIKQVSLIDPISVNGIEGVQLNATKSNIIYGTPKFLELFPVLPSTLSVGVNTSKGLGYKAFESVVKDLGQNPKDILTYKTYPEFKIVSLSSRKNMKFPEENVGYAKMASRFLELRRLNQKGELNNDETLVEEFLQLSNDFNVRGEGEVSRIYGLLPVPDIKRVLQDELVERMFAKDYPFIYNILGNKRVDETSYEELVKILNSEEYKFLLRDSEFPGIRKNLNIDNHITEIPLLTIKLTDELVEMLLEDTPIRIRKRKGGKV